MCSRGAWQAQEPELYLEVFAFLKSMSHKEAVAIEHTMIHFIHRLSEPRENGRG